MNQVASDISVVIPFYKAEKYFSETIKSVLSQKLPAKEIIVVVDGKELHDMSFFDRFECNQLKIVILDNNQGVANARNRGVSEANCEWIAFLDADDKWDEDKLFAQIQCLKANPELAGCHTGISTFNDDKIISSYTDKPPLLLEEHLAVCSHVLPSSFLIKKAVYDKLNGMDPKFRSCEDYEFEIRLVTAGYKIGFVPRALCLLRREDHGNLSSASWRILYYHIRVLIRHREMFFRNGGTKTIRQYLAKSFKQSGGSLGGAQGKVLSLIGIIIGY